MVTIESTVWLLVADLAAVPIWRQTYLASESETASHHDHVRDSAHIKSAPALMKYA